MTGVQTCSLPIFNADKPVISPQITGQIIVLVTIFSLGIKNIFLPVTDKVYVLKKDTHQLSRLSVAGLLISMGIIYGDIGTSPLYVFKAVVGDKIITDDLIMGALYCIFWTLTLQTTVKYVLIKLSADNKETGDFFTF